MDTKMLTEAEVSAINVQFALDLSYDNATHYRAAQTIWSLAKLKGVELPDQEAIPAPDTPEADQALEDNASSYPKKSDDTVD